MTVTLTLVSNATVAKIVTDDKTVKNAVSEMLSYAIEGAEFMHGFGAGKWNGRSSFFSHRTCAFPAGFSHLVYSELTRLGHKVNWVRQPASAPLGAEDPIVDAFGNGDPRYAFQLQALRQVEKHKRGIIQVATGGGKSKIAKLVTARYRRMTLFLTTRGVLMYQMKDAYERDCGFNVGVVGDGVWAPVRGVNVGMVQTLVAKLQEPTVDSEIRALVKSHAELQEKNRKKGLPVPADLVRADLVKVATEKVKVKALERLKTIKLLEMVEVVIGEEAHEAGGNSYFEILKHCKNAHIRVALTATPFMRESAEDNMRLMAAFGPTLIKITEKQLIDCGILAKPFFKYVESQPHPKLRKTSPFERAYKLGYTDNSYMHADIISDAVKAAHFGLPVLTLIARKNHGEVLKQVMQDKGLRVVFLRGENDQAERQQALNRLIRGEIDVLIGTTILDVGVDVPAIGLVQLCGGMKAEVSLRQRVGRGLRAKKPPLPNVAFIVDYSTGVNQHIRNHTRQRRAIIEATPGFAENILPPGKDFDWSQFKQARKAA